MNLSADQKVRNSKKKKKKVKICHNPGSQFRIISFIRPTVQVPKIFSLAVKNSKSEVEKL